jgi:hypothetical protein
MRFSRLPNAAEPLLLAGVVGVREQERNLDPVREQHAYAANAHFAVGEYHSPRHRGMA